MRALSRTFVATLLARTCAATLPTPPSAADKWLYPDINTVPTFNYLDTVNASWTSNFVKPFLLLRCQHPNDAVHYAYPYNRSVPATGSTVVPLDDGNAWICHFEVSDLSTSGTTPPTFISNDFNIVLHDGQKPVLWTSPRDDEGSSAAPNPTTASPTAARTSTSNTTTSSVTTTRVPPFSAASNHTIAPTTSPTTTNSSATPSTPTQSPAAPTPSSTPSGLSKSKKIAIIIGSIMGALFLLIIAIAVRFILRTRRSEQNAVLYTSERGDGSEGKGVSGSERPRERWKGPDIPSGRT